MLFKDTCYVTVTLLRKLQLTYTLHVTSCLLGYREVFNTKSRS